MVAPERRRHADVGGGGAHLHTHTKQTHARMRPGERSARRPASRSAAQSGAKRASVAVAARSGVHTGEARPGDAAARPEGAACAREVRTPPPTYPCGQGGVAHTALRRDKDRAVATNRPRCETRREDSDVSHSVRGMHNITHVNTRDTSLTTRDMRYVIYDMTGVG